MQMGDAQNKKNLNNMVSNQQQTQNQNNFCIKFQYVGKTL